MNKTRLFQTIFLFFICNLVFLACYRMPEEDEYSVVPSTNNPDMTREKPNNSLVPGMGF